MSGVEAMIAQAIATLGVGERNGNNTNYITQWYGLNDAWCDMSVTYWAYHSDNAQAVCFGGKFAYTVAHAQAFQARGQWHSDIAGIQRGDIVFFDWSFSNNIANIDHVGIVERVVGNTVYTIEGNIGNVCARKVRYAAEIAGYGRPKYINTAVVNLPPAGSVSSPSVPAPSNDNRPWVYVGQLNHAAEWDPPAENGHRSYCWQQVLLVEKALVGEGLLALNLADGSYGTSTLNAYAAWQRRLGYTGTAADGKPGLDSLSKLGNKYGFRVGA